MPAADNVRSLQKSHYLAILFSGKVVPWSRDLWTWKGQTEREAWDPKQGRGAHMAGLEVGRHR